MQFDFFLLARDGFLKKSHKRMSEHLINYERGGYVVGVD